VKPPYVLRGEVLLGILPEPREEESLYSVLARFYRYLGAPEAAAFMRATFADRFAIASHDLPGNLMRIADLAGSGDGTKVLRDLIDSQTGFRFHTAFVEHKVRSSVFEAMGGDVTGIHARLGITAFAVRPISRLRFCLECLDEMEARHDDLWWRRDQQLPGVLVCPVHGCMLRSSTVRIGDRNRHAFRAATREVCREDAEPVVPSFDRGSDPLLHDLARRAATLLVEPRPVISHSARVDLYREKLALVGLMRSQEKVDQRALHEVFSAHWDEVPMLVPGLTMGDPGGFSWLASIVRDRRKAFHPLQHLMLEGMLQGMGHGEIERPFGPGPWLCRNPAAPHFGREVVENLRVRRDRDMRYGDFECSCGYMYTRSISPDGAIGEPRYRRFGPLFAPALKRAMSKDGSLRSIARELGLDPKTLVREAQIASVQVPWTLRPSGGIPAHTDSIHSPSAHKRSSRKPVRRARRNWFAIDARLQHSVALQHQAILAVAPPLRASFAELERRVAKVGWVSKRSAKLPMTLNAIHEASEPLDEFRWRRLAWHAQRMAASGRATPSDLLRAAGLPSSWMGRARDTLASVYLADMRRAS
jgi:hypothetical protein